MIKLENLTAGYGGKPVLQGIHTTFAEDGFSCIIGANGSGKSTLLRALAGVQPYTGEIFLDGVELMSLPRRERAQRVAYLPQSRPIPAINARTLISHGRFPHLGFSKTLTAADHAMVERAASLTRAEDLLDRELPELSGGERQRVYLAMVVAQDARVILLDEPATYLDVNHQLELIELLETLHRAGKCVVMVAHDLPQAFSCATDLKLLQNGALLQEGAPAQLCGSAHLQECFGLTLRPAETDDELYRYRMVKR